MPILYLCKIIYLELFSQAESVMKNKQIFKKTIIFTVFTTCLFLQNYSWAIDTMNPEQQNSPVAQDNEINTPFQNDSNKNEDIAPSIQANDSGAKVDAVGSLINSTKTRSQTNKPFAFLNSSSEEPTKNPAVKKNSRYTITFKGKTTDLKKYLHLSTLIAFVGLAGTFFGLFSTWLIYHLNKKHNNPLLIDKHNSAINYMDELNKIKFYYSHSDIKGLYSTLNNSNKNSQEELQRLIISYEELCKNTSKIDILTIHNRYRKHMNKRKQEIFESLIENYKMIKIDGDYLTNSGEDCHIFDLQNPINLKNIKSKIMLVLTFEQQIDVILGILRKELKI